MGRWQPDARERLERAALELFLEHGFAETTVPQITARAGLTTRTFFRYFADKREVLFADGTDVPALASQMIAAAPPSSTPMEIVVAGLDTVAEARFSAGADYYRARRTVIASDHGLRERELHKLSAMTEALQAGFAQRGVDDLTATLIAHATVTVFSVSIGRWLDQDGDLALPDILHHTLDTFRSTMADPSWSPVDARQPVSTSQVTA